MKKGQTGQCKRVCEGKGGNRRRGSGLAGRRSRAQQMGRKKKSTSTAAQVVGGQDADSDKPDADTRPSDVRNRGRLEQQVLTNALGRERQ